MLDIARMLFTQLSTGTKMEVDSQPVMTNHLVLKM